MYRNLEERADNEMKDIYQALYAIKIRRSVHAMMHWLGVAAILASFIAVITH